MKKLSDYQIKELPQEKPTQEPQEIPKKESKQPTSPKPLSEKKRHDIETIATTIRNVLDDFVETKVGNKAGYRINKIILFGSHAKGTWVNDPVNGYVSDYDILVIVNKDELVEEYEVWQSVEDKIARKVTAPLGLIVHTLADMNTMLQQGHYFFTDIRDEGIELYSVDGKVLAQSNNIPKEEQLAIANKHWEQWFESAKEFVIDFGHCLDRKNYRKAAFELHQAAERFFACTLLVCTNYLPRTHNIEHLRSLCAQQNPEFAMLFPADNKDHRRSFQLLKRAYVDGRYSEHYTITLDELNYLASEVTKLQTITEATCKAKIESYEN